MRARENERARQMELGMLQQINGSDLTRCWRATAQALVGLNQSNEGNVCEPNSSQVHFANLQSADCSDAADGIVMAFTLRYRSG